MQTVQFIWALQSWDKICCPREGCPRRLANFKRLRSIVCRLGNLLLYRERLPDMEFSATFSNDHIHFPRCKIQRAFVWTKSHLTQVFAKIYKCFLRTFSFSIADLRTSRAFFPQMIYIRLKRRSFSFRWSKGQALDMPVAQMNSCAPKGRFRLNRKGKFAKCRKIRQCVLSISEILSIRSWISILMAWDLLYLWDVWIYYFMLNC